MFDINLVNQNRYSVRTLAKGQTLFYEGEKCVVIGIVLQGSLKISSFTYSGDELLLKNLEEGDLFGNNLIYSQKPLFRGSIESKEDGTRVALFTKDSLEAALSENKEFLHHYLVKLAQDGDKLNIDLKTISIQDVKERLFYYLNANGGSVRFESVTDLALRLNMRRETLSRLLTKVIESGEVKRVRKTLFINK